VDKQWKDVWFVAASADGCNETMDIAGCRCSYMSMFTKNWFATCLWGWGREVGSFCLRWARW